MIGADEVVPLAVFAGSVEAYTPGGQRRDFSFNIHQLIGFSEQLKRQVLQQYAEESDGVLVEEIARLRSENEALRKEMLTPEVFQSVVDWLREDPIRPASGAFTASMERQIAYALEMDVVPALKAARIRCRNGKPDED